MEHNLTSYLTKKQITLLFLSAFIIRAVTFQYFIDPTYRYNQPDTKDYHVCAIGLAEGRGMSYYNTTRPVFWRTPGYPFLLLPFYKYYGVKGLQLEHYKSAHQMFLWLQILICSLLPILVFLLAMLLTGSHAVAWIASIISIAHLGFVLSSTYLMTDALTTMLFLLFLYYFYRSIPMPFEVSSNKSNSMRNIIIAACALSLCTWMRPMGIYVSLIATFLIILAQLPFQKKLLNIFVFLFIFFGSLSPWYARNYLLTGSAFFCPLWGPYTLTFLVPKIYQRIHNSPEPLMKSIQKFLVQARHAYEDDVKEKYESNSPYVTCKEHICSKIANPWLKAHPWYFMLDWTIEIIKTTCDLYSGHLVNFVRNNFNTEPPVEFLGEKLRDCLYKQEMPKTMRMICWLEALFHLLILFGLMAGTSIFVFYPLTKMMRVDIQQKQRFMLWIKTGLFIALIIGMTGGFGYARLRLPVEALMIILALDFWLWLAPLKRISLFTYQKNHNQQASPV